MVQHTVVIPCYCSEQSLSSVIDATVEVLARLGGDFEIILVNDFSRDQTWKEISRLSEKYPQIIGLNLGKNFGQPNALMAGFSFASGEYVISMDDDGQSPVEQLSAMKEKLQEGFDVVCAKYTERPQKSRIRRLGSKGNDWLHTHVLGKPTDVYLSSFFIAKKYVIREILRYTQPFPYIAALLLRCAGRIGNVEMAQKDRMAGESNYDVGKLLKLFSTGLTAFSPVPLRLAGLMGSFNMILGLALGLYSVIRKIYSPQISFGVYAILAFLFFLTGIILWILRIVGEYLGRIFMCINNEPQYIIKETIMHSKGGMQNDEKITQS